VEWTTHVLRVDRRDEHTETWSKNVKGKSPLGRCKRRWEASSLKGIIMKDPHTNDRPDLSSERAPQN
jgi:hypothetical protein